MFEIANQQSEFLCKISSDQISNVGQSKYDLKVKGE